MHLTTSGAEERAAKTARYQAPSDGFFVHLSPYAGRGAQLHCVCGFRDIGELALLPRPLRTWGDVACRALGN